MQITINGLDYKLGLHNRIFYRNSEGTWLRSSMTVDEFKLSVKKHSAIKVEAKKPKEKSHKKNPVKKYHGRECQRCGTTEKYERGQRCVVCNILRSTVRNHEKRESKKRAA